MDKKVKKRIIIAVLCVVVLVICVYYFATKDKNKNDQPDTTEQLFPICEVE